MQQNVKRKRYKIIYIKYYIDVVVVVVFIFFFLGSISFSLLLILFLPFDFFFFFFLVSLILLLLLLVASMAYGHTLNRDADRKRSKSITIYLLSAVIPFTYSASVAASVCTVVLEPDREMEGKTAVLCASSTFRPVFVFCCYCCCRWPAVRTAIYDTDVNLREMRYDAILLYSYFVGVLVSLQCNMPICACTVSAIRLVQPAQHMCAHPMPRACRWSLASDRTTQIGGQFRSIRWLANQHSERCRADDKQIFILCSGEWSASALALFLMRVLYRFTCRLIFVYRPFEWKTCMFVHTDLLWLLLLLSFWFRAKP